MSACANMHVWGAGMRLCTHPASSGTWGGRGWFQLCPLSPAMLDLPGSLPQVTPWGPTLPGRGWQRGQVPPGLQVQEAPAGHSSPSPSPLPRTVMQEGHSWSTRSPRGSAVPPRTMGQPGLFLPGDRVLWPGSPYTTALLTSRLPGSAKRKSRRYQAAGYRLTQPQPLPEISWHDHHNSIVLGFAFSTKRGASSKYSFPLSRGVEWGGSGPPGPLHTSGEEETWILMRKETVLSPALVLNRAPRPHRVYELG